MSAPAVELKGLGKHYGGRNRGHWALRGVDLTFSRGEVVGFIGPNGAGKTTLIKLICGLSRASEGEIRVLGQDLMRRAVTPPGIGLLLESPAFIPYSSGRKNLKLLADIRGIVGNEEIADALRMVGLDPHDRRPARAYSLGMRQRLGLAQALMEKPRLLLLDEPTNGLDPAGIIELRGLIRRLAESGVAIFMASHLLTEVEQVCNRVLLVREGRVIKELDQEQIEAPALKLTVTSKADLEPLLEWARKSGARIEPVRGSPLEVNIVLNRPVPRTLRELALEGVNIEEVGKVRRSLEQEFLELIGAEE
jgi:ABC-2 type transport system ATP-binding protein